MEDTFDLYDDLEEFQQKQEEVKLWLEKFRIELLSLHLIKLTNFMYQIYDSFVQKL